MKAIFISFKNQFDRDIEKYQDKVNINKINGLKGGRPKTQKEPTKTQKIRVGLSETQHIPKKGDNDNVNDNVSVNDNDRETRPTLIEFLSYAKTLKIYKPEFDYSLEAKFNQWNESGWKDGNGNLIKNWKTKLQNTFPYLKPTYSNNKTSHQNGIDIDKIWS